MEIKSFILILVCTVSIISAQQEDKRLSGKINLGLSVIVTEGRTDYAEAPLGVGLIVSSEYFVPSQYRSKFGIRLIAGGQNVYGEDNRKVPSLMRSDMFLAGVGMNYAYEITRSFYPYIYLGVSNLWFDPKFDDGTRAPNNQKNLYDKRTVSYDIGGGLRIFLSDVTSLMGELQIHFPDTDYFDDYKSGDFKDTYLSASLGISFTMNVSRDDDNDGIPNKLDPCPKSAEDFDGFEDDDGCPDYDNDKDGLTDNNDKCPNSSEDMDGFEDDDGCPDFDNDKDGIPDQQDECSNYSEDFDGFEDQDGCPDADNDNDGIPDNKDMCINAAEDFDGFEDDDGCPDPDNDNDGIVDTLDKCPDKPENINGFNDQDGCPDKITEIKEKKPEPDKPVKEKDITEISVPVKEKDITEIPVSTSQNVFVIPASDIFSGKGTQLKSADIPALNRFVKMLQNDINSRWKIEVYMDSQGPSGEMVSISKKRADAVLQYFVSKGLPSFLFQTVGMGSKNPVAGNDTNENRAKNRRIVLRKFR